MEKFVITPALSKKIYRFSFLMSLLITTIHCYPENFGLSGGNTSLFLKFSNIICLFTQHITARIAVPFFFILSGFLIFIKYENTFRFFKSLLLKRFHSLVIPYLFWNASVMCLCILLKGIFLTESPELAQITTRNIFLGTVFYYYNGVMWFVYQLFLFILYAAPIYFLLKRKPIAILAICASLFLALTTFLGAPLPHRPIFDTALIIPNFGCLFYFCIGGFIALHTPSITLPLDSLKRTSTKFWIFILCILLFYLVRGSLTLDPGPENLLKGIAANLALLIGIVGAWGLYDFIPTLRDTPLKDFEKCAFFIYFAHQKLLFIIQVNLVAILGANPNLALLGFFFSIATCIAALIISIPFLKKVPLLWKLMSGGRG